MLQRLVCALCLGLFSLTLFATETALKPLTVILDWFPNPDHAPLYVAQQQGYFAQHGLTVKLIAPSDPNDPPKWVAAKQADIGITYEPQFMQQVDRGLPLIRFGTLINHPLNCLVALESSGIKTLADLKTKRIGSAHSGGLNHIMLDVMLAKAKLSSQDVTLINVRYNLTQALLSHRVDAVTGLNRNIEVPQLNANHHRVRIFLPEDHGIPTYDELIFVTHLDEAHDPRLSAFLAALKEAVAYLHAHPQQSWEAFARVNPAARNAVNEHIWYATIPYFANDPATLASMQWKDFSQFMYSHGLISKTQALSRYAISLNDSYTHKK